MASRKKPTFDQEAAFKSIIGARPEEPEMENLNTDMAYKTTQEQKKETPGKGRPKTGMETKKRVTLALYPSVYSDLQKIAYVQRKSISEIVSKLLTAYIKDNANKLEEYESIKND